MASNPVCKQQTCVSENVKQHSENHLPPWSELFQKSYFKKSSKQKTLSNFHLTMCKMRRNTKPNDAQLNAIKLPANWSVLPVSNAQGIKAFAQTFEQTIGRILDTCAKLQNAELTFWAARASKARRNYQHRVGRCRKYMLGGEACTLFQHPPYVYMFPLFVLDFGKIGQRLAKLRFHYLSLSSFMFEVDFNISGEILKIWSVSGENCTKWRNMEKNAVIWGDTM